MELVTLINHSAQLIEIILKSYQPSDLIASDYFRKKKYIGSHDRKFISEVTFSTIRLKSLVESCAGEASEKINFLHDSDNQFLNVAATCIISEINPDKKKYSNPKELYSVFTKNESLNFKECLTKAVSSKFNIADNISKDWIDTVQHSYLGLTNLSDTIIKNTKTDNISLDIICKRYSFPRWILDELIGNGCYKISLKEAANLAESFLYPAPLTVRVNENQIRRDNAISFFERLEIPVKPCKLSPSGIIIERRIQLSENELFKNGFIDVQDEGSQLIAFALAPELNDRILDACAGAGGKSLHLASIQSDSGEIIANDIDSRRLRELMKRARKSSFNSIKTIIIKNENFDKKLRESFDCVLIDAPCSGLGTIRRMPMQKWRLSESLLEKYVKKQMQIIEFYSQFLRPGGTLVYATCSIMPQENDFVVDSFLKNNENFVPDSLSEAFEKSNVKIDEINKDDYKYHVLTSHYGCDSFFIARMKRIS